MINVNFQKGSQGACQRKGLMNSNKNMPKCANKEEEIFDGIGCILSHFFFICTKNTIIGTYIHI